MPPRPKEVPLTRIEEEVEITCPCALVERSEFGRPRVRLEVDAVAKEAKAETDRSEVEALVMLRSLEKVVDAPEKTLEAAKIEEVAKAEALVVEKPRPREEK